MGTTLTARMISKIAFVTLLFSGFIASAKANPLQGMVLRVAAVDQFSRACGENLCQVTLTYSDSIRGAQLARTEVEVFVINNDKIATSRGIIEVNGSFEVSGRWFQIDASARRIVAANAPNLPAVARN